LKLREQCANVMPSPRKDRMARTPIAQQIEDAMAKVTEERASK
jgi:hypothetical protein